MNVINISGAEQITKAIVTHDGAFHADEVLSIAILSIVYPDLGVIRTHDREAVTMTKMTVDIDRGEFNHHQPGDSDSRENILPYTAAGLFWRKFGIRVFMALGNKLEWPAEYYRHIENVVDRIDWEFDSVDADDCEESVTSPVGWDFSALIAGLNPASFENASNLKKDEAFLEAVKMAKVILSSKVKSVLGEFLAE